MSNRARVSQVAGSIGLMLLAGCGTVPAPPPVPVEPALPAEVIEGPPEVLPTPVTSVEFPARIIGNLFVVETVNQRDGPWRFLIDTGSSATLVSPEYAIRHRSPNSPANTPKVWLRDAQGRASPVDSIILDRIDFGPAHFLNVRGLVYDCSELSRHLGVQIDGVLGFPLFRKARLSLDYPGERVVLASLEDPAPLRGCILPYAAPEGVPEVTVSLGARAFKVLVDSGSDGPFNLDPSGIELSFASPPREGATVATLFGNHRQLNARLNSTLYIGDHTIERPIVDLSGVLTSLGGELLRNFVVTFDQERHLIGLEHPDAAPIVTPSKLSPGLSFEKNFAYWRVVGVVPNSPASHAGFEGGELVVRVNGDPVELWDLERFRALVDRREPIEYTLLEGVEETTRTLAPVVLVP